MDPLPPGYGALHLTLQGSHLTAGVIVPSVYINGHRMPSRYGVNVYPLQPGHYQLDVHAYLIGAYGHTHLGVRIDEGTSVQAFYGPPMHMFARGTIGPTPQQRRGWGLIIVWLVLFVIGPCSALLAIAVLSSLS